MVSTKHKRHASLSYLHPTTDSLFVAYVSIRQHTSAYVSIRQHTCIRLLTVCSFPSPCACYTAESLAEFIFPDP